MSPVRIRIQRFNQQSYLGPSESNCENYFELHPVPEMLGSLSMMVFGTGHLERVGTCHASLQEELEEFAELPSPGLATSSWGAWD